MKRLISLLLLLFLVEFAFAANNPGHDTLYILKLGDNMTGSLNISGNITATIVQFSSKAFGNRLDVVANGTDLGTGPSVPRIMGTALNQLYIDAPEGIYLNRYGGTNKIVQVGDPTTNGITFNVSGTIYQQNQLLCLANGSNCPSLLGGANTTGSGTANYVTKWTSGSGIGNSLIYDSGTNVGIGTTSPSQKLDVNGNGNFSGSNAVVYINGSLACTAANGLCGSSGYISTSGGWTNTSTQTTTTLDLNVGSGTLFVNSTSTNVGIGTTNATEKLTVNNGRVLSIGTSYTNSGFVIKDLAAGSGDWRLLHFSGGAFSINYNGDTSTDSKLLVDTTGNVGIGTVSPNQKLTVNGNGNFSGTNAAVYINGSIACTAANGLCGSSGYISSSGGWTNTSTQTTTSLNVGIGTAAAPTSLLDIVGGGIEIDRTGGDSYIVFEQAGTGTGQIRGTASGIGISDSSGSNKYLFVNTTSTNVGIGTSAPNAKLEVAGDILVGATTNTGRIKSDGTNTLVDAIPVSGAVILRTGGAVEAMRVTSTGGVGIGTTTPKDSLQIKSSHVFGEKSYAINSSWQTVLTVNVSGSHRSTIIKGFYGGSDWSCHSAPSFSFDAYLKDGAGGYGDPGTVQRTYYFEPSSNDYIEVNLVKGTGNLIYIQLKTNDGGDGYVCGASSTTQIFVYEIEGAFSSIA